MGCALREMLDDSGREERGKRAGPSSRNHLEQQPPRTSRRHGCGGAGGGYVAGGTAHPARKCATIFGLAVARERALPIPAGPRKVRAVRKSAKFQHAPQSQSRTPG